MQLKFYATYSILIVGDGRNMDLAMIRKQYGEKMMQMCRRLFPTILEHEGKLYEIIQNNFAPSKFLHDDIVAAGNENQFKNYIYSQFYVTEPDFTEMQDVKTPQELLSEAGYILFDECQTEEDIQAFRKYYAPGEELCTFRGGRLSSCRVFFAVKRDVGSIRREDFSKPMRQDKYGTSVISIQFSKGDFNTLSIKNRYNHTVPDCDATFSNDLENITAGLTESFEQHYGLNLSHTKGKSFELPGYIRAADGKLYKYNYEYNNIYYCPGNIIIDNFRVIEDYREMEKYIVLDYFILDLQNKKIIVYDSGVKDSFVDIHGSIKKIDIRKHKETQGKTIELTLEDGSVATIGIDKENKIVSYENKTIKKIGDKFLKKSEFLETLSMPSLEQMGNDCFYVTSLNSLVLPCVKQIGDNCFVYSSLGSVDLPLVEKIGNSFMYSGATLESISLPNVKELGHQFMYQVYSLKKISLPCVEVIGDSFLPCNAILEDIYVPNVQYIGDSFMCNSNGVTSINLLSVKRIGNNFMCNNNSVTNVSCPIVEKIGSAFFKNNEVLSVIELPLVEEIGDEFLKENRALTSLTQLSNEQIRLYLMHQEALFTPQALPIFPAGYRLEGVKVVLLNLSPQIISYINSNFVMNKGKDK